jgi:hypothetical protein
MILPFVEIGVTGALAHGRGGRSHHLSVRMQSGLESEYRD